MASILPLISLHIKTLQKEKTELLAKSQKEKAELLAKCEEEKAKVNRELWALVSQNDLLVETCEGEKARLRRKYMREIEELEWQISLKNKKG